MAIGHQSRARLGPGVVVEQDCGARGGEAIEQRLAELHDRCAEAVGDVALLPRRSE